MKFHENKLAKYYRRKMRKQIHTIRMANQGSHCNSFPSNPQILRSMHQYKNERSTKERNNLSSMDVINCLHYGSKIFCRTALITFININTECKRPNSGMSL
uniref:Uncharacterized protein n=1 Tax=Opuntia streptacantha TaxID=393608 RepID=A0A7C9E7U2_OPUST